jgi:hypothetical protein
MSSKRFNECLNTSNHGPPHLFKDARVAVDSPTGIHDVMVKCLFVDNRSCMHKGFQVSPQVKIQRIQIWRVWRPCSGSSSTYPSVMIGVTKNISHSTAKMCSSTIMHSFSSNSQIKRFRTHVDVGIFWFGMRNSWPKHVCIFQLHLLYVIHGITIISLLPKEVVLC